MRKFLCIFLLLFSFSHYSYANTSINLQPGSEGMDSFVGSGTIGSETTILPDSNYGSDPRLIMASNCTSYIKFELPDLFTQLWQNPLNSPVSANLLLYIESLTGSNIEIGIGYTAYQWDENTITYDNRPFCLAIPEGKFSFDENFTGGWVSINITNFVYYWINYPTSNHGVAMSLNSADGVVVAYSSDADPEFHPILELSYHAPVPEPSVIFLCAMGLVPLLRKHKK